MAEFFNMGGYALYVWGSFGVTLLVMIIELVLVKKKQSDVVRRLSRLQRLNAEVENEAQT